MGIYGFTIQLYCDFSGYSDMAIGIALLLGYKLKMNFDAPFKSQSPTGIGAGGTYPLSSWLRDYLYIPMGGNRCSKARAHMNVFNTMLIGGLWHGASWMYVIWGAWNGGLLVAHKMIRSVTPRVKGGESSQMVASRHQCVHNIQPHSRGHDVFQGPFPWSRSATWCIR